MAYDQAFAQRVRDLVEGEGPMHGWLDVDGTVTADDAALRELVAGAVAHARSLPPRR